MRDEGDDDLDSERERLPVSSFVVLIVVGPRTVSTLDDDYDSEEVEDGLARGHHHSWS